MTLVQVAEGLSRQEARARYDKIGPNEMPYRPEAIWVSIAEEMFTLFKVYQFLIYSIWLWLSYLFVGALLLSIVLVAALITTANRRRAQFAIAKVCGPVTLLMPQIVSRILLKSEHHNGRWVLTSTTVSFLPASRAQVRASSECLESRFLALSIQSSTNCIQVLT